MLFLSTRRVVIFVPILLLAVAGIVLALKPQWGKSWLANRYAARAEALAKAGGHEAARISATKTL